jgi:ribosomal protein L24E
MRYGTCCFSGHGIPKGKGRIVVLPNGSSYLLGTRKARSYFLKGIKPRKVAWTLSARIAKNKTASIEKGEVRKGTKVVKTLRSFAGMSLEELKSKMKNKDAPVEPMPASSRHRRKAKIRNASKQ